LYSRHPHIVFKLLLLFVYPFYSPGKKCFCCVEEYYGLEESMLIGLGDKQN